MYGHGIRRYEDDEYGDFHAYGAQSYCIQNRDLPHSHPSSGIWVNAKLLDTRRSSHMRQCKDRDISH